MNLRPGFWVVLVQGCLYINDLISGTQKVYVKTWGCSHNSSDSEYMAGLLADYGYKIVGKLKNKTSHAVYLLLQVINLF